jgi:adenosylmethionine-8-amino-7-oxononanoate aminotransferase
VWLRPFGRLVYAMPPYITTDEDIDRIGAAMVDAVTRVRAG